MTKTEHDEDDTTVKVAIVVGLVFAVSIAATAWVIIVGLDGRPGAPTNEDTEQELIERRLDAAADTIE